MQSLAFATIKELKQLIADKKVTVEEVLRYYLNRLKKYDPKINSALEVFGEESIMADFQSEGALQGIPGLIKDNICQQGRAMTCASKILEGFTATYDATAIARLKREGALLVGRANMDEFAMGSSTETSAFGKTLNPWDCDRVPGGSSGGSAAAVAAGLVPWALGSETGGSVRQPAGFCGVVGLKPTYGLVSRYGLTAYASSLDQIGVFTRTVYDNALVFSAIAGKDIRDSSSLPAQKKDYTGSLDGTLKEGLTIGYIDNMLNAEGVDPEVKASIEAALAEYEKLGATIKPITVPILEYAASAYFIISRAEAASNLARYEGVICGYRDKEADTLDKMYKETRHNGFGNEIRSRIMVGNYVLSAGHAAEFYDNAKMVQRMIRKELHQAFSDVDLLIAPTSPAAAFKLGAFEHDPLQMDLQDFFTCFANLAGIPGLSVPCGMSSDGLPIGYQLVGPHLSEELLFQTAHAYEQATPWHTMKPKGFE